VIHHVIDNKIHHIIGDWEGPLRQIAAALLSCPGSRCRWSRTQAFREEAQRLLSLTEGADAAQPGLGEDLRATAFISLGIAEMWALRLEDAERHLTQGLVITSLPSPDEKTDSGS
jgi:hypothetical protein